MLLKTEWHADAYEADRLLLLLPDSYAPARSLIAQRLEGGLISERIARDGKIATKAEAAYRMAAKCEFGLEWELGAVHKN